MHVRVTDKVRDPHTNDGDCSPRQSATGNPGSGRPTLKSRLWKLVRRNISSFSLLVVSALATVLTFQESLITFNDDTFFPLDLGVGIVRNWYAWSNGPSSSPNLSVIELPLYVIKSITGSLVFSQEAFLFTLFAVSGVGTVTLCRVLFRRHSHAPEFVVGFLYTFNFYTLTCVWNSFKLWSVFYSLLPLVIVLFVLALRATRISRTIALLTVSGFLAGLGGPFPAPLLILILIAISIAASDRVRWSKIALVLGLFVLLYGFVNAYEFLPALSALGTTLSQHTAQEPTSLFFAFPLAQNPLNSIRLLGYEFVWYWGWGVPNYAWTNEVLGNLILVLASYCPFLLAVYGLLSRPLGTVRVRAAALALLLIGILVGSAGSKPFGPDVFAILSATGLAQVYEIPFESFGLLIVLSYVLLGYEGMADFFHQIETEVARGISTLKVQRAGAGGRPKGGIISQVRPAIRLERSRHLEWHSRETILGVCVIFLLVIGVLLDSVPVWQGEIVTGELNRGPNQIPVPSGHISIPEQYKKFNTFATSLDHDYSLLVLPPYSPAPHSWPPGNETASDPLIEYFVGGMTIVNLDSLGPSPVTAIVNQLVSANATASEFLAVLGHLSVRYILVEKDWLPLYYYETNATAYERYLSQLQHYSPGTLTSIWNSSRLSAYQIMSPSPLPILSVVPFAYATGNDSQSFESFLSYPVNSEVGIVPISASNVAWGLPNVLTAYSLTENRSGFADLKSGSYSVFLQGQATRGSIPSGMEPLTVTLGNESVSVNLTRMSSVAGSLSGETPIGTLDLPVTSTENASIAGGQNASFLNASTLRQGSDIDAKSGWTYNNKTGAINATVGNLSIGSEFPSTASLGFSLSIPDDPTQTSYGGVFLVNLTSPSDSVGLIIREGVDNTSGGILLVTGDGITINAAYDNLPLHSNCTYSMNLTIRRGEIQVDLNGNPLDFLRGGSSVTSDNFTSIPEVGGYDAVDFQTNGLPLQIGNIDGVYSPFLINGVLFRENVQGNLAGSIAYGEGSVSPVTFKLSIQQSPSPQPIAILSGFYGSDWYASQSSWPAPAFPLIRGDSVALSSGLYGLENFVQLPWNHGVILIVYGPQVSADAGTVITISTGMFGIFMLLGSHSWTLIRPVRRMTKFMHTRVTRHLNLGCLSKFRSGRVRMFWRKHRR